MFLKREIMLAKEDKDIIPFTADYIKVEVFPSGFNIINDKGKVKKIINLLNNLIESSKLIKKLPDDGVTYKIIIYYNYIKKEITFHSNKYIKYNGYWRQIEYGQAEKFESLLYKVL